MRTVVYSSTRHIALLFGQSRSPLRFISSASSFWLPLSCCIIFAPSISPLHCSTFLAPSFFFFPQFFSIFLLHVLSRGIIPAPSVPLFLSCPICLDRFLSLLSLAFSYFLFFFSILFFLPSVFFLHIYRALNFFSFSMQSLLTKRSASYCVSVLQTLPHAFLDSLRSPRPRQVQRQ